MEIIHWQEPDNHCAHVVFVDGIEVSHVTYEVNPKEPHTRLEWDELTDYLCAMATPLAVEVLRASRDDAASNSRLIDN